MDSEGLISTFEQTLRKTRDAQTRLMSRLREVEAEGDRLRQEIQAMDSSASQTEAAILHLLATMRSGNPSWTDENYDLSEMQRQKQSELNNQLQFNRENQAKFREDNHSNYKRESNQSNYNREDNYSNYDRDDHRQNYNRNNSVAYLNNNSRHVPTINPQREPISRRFADKTITQACSLLLREAGEPLHVNELFNMLTAGGMNFTGNNPTISIAVSLNRNKRFRKVAPGTFDLVMKEVSKAAS